MKICHYNENEAGAVVGGSVHPIGAALVGAGHLKPGYTMLEVIDALANVPAAMQCARDCLRAAAALPLASVKLLAPILNPPSLWAAAAHREGGLRIGASSLTAPSGSPDGARRQSCAHCIAAGTLASASITSSMV